MTCFKRIETPGCQRGFMRSAAAERCEMGRATRPAAGADYFSAPVLGSMEKICMLGPIL